MTSPRWHSACGLLNKKLRRPIPYALMIPLRVPRASHCTTASVQKTSIRVAPDPRPRYHIPLALAVNPHIVSEHHHRTSPVKRINFIPVEVQQTNMNSGQFVLHSITIPLMMRGHFLPSGSGRPRLTIAQRKGSASTIFSRGLPASVDHAPNSIRTIRSHIPLSIRNHSIIVEVTQSPLR